VTARGRRFLLCHLADGTGILTLRFFHFSPAQQQLAWSAGYRDCAAFGEVRPGYNGGLEMIHPECRRVEPDTPIEERLTPFYPATAGLQQFTLRNLAEAALAQLETAALLPELLPPALLARLQSATHCRGRAATAPAAGGNFGCRTGKRSPSGPAATGL
jgi:ATP-dependent DNA helicase RecG